MELFLRDGYDATTVAAIARAAGVSHMTFFRHFQTKESVVLDDPYDPIIAERVASQPATLPALERVRRGFAQAGADVPEPMDAEVRARIRLVAGHPALRARMWENTQRTERAVVDALLAGEVPRLQALVAAAACLGALTAARSEPFCAGLAGSSDRRIVGTVTGVLVSSSVAGGSDRNQRPAVPVGNRSARLGLPRP